MSRKAWDSGDWLHDMPWPGVHSTPAATASPRPATRSGPPAPPPPVTAVHGAPAGSGTTTAAGCTCTPTARSAPDGPAGIAADLPSKLEHYRLPDPPGTAAELRAAARHSVGLMTVLPARIGASARRARLPGRSVSHGAAGDANRAARRRMTSMAKVTLHHFAPD